MASNPYGYCPVCYRPGKSRERRPNGNDMCEGGHTYPSAKAIPNDPKDLNNGETHGYVWPDGTTRTAPYEPGVFAKVKNDPDFPRKEAEPLRSVTQATLDKAYADWLKEYTRWKAAFAEWEAKYGKR